MIKEIIILAASEKYRNYCIAGIDTNTGEWIRVVSEDDSIENAVTIEDMRYEDGFIPNIFDVVRIEFMRHEPSFYQTENFILDNLVYWEKIRTTDIGEVLKIHPPENKPYIFYDTDKRIHKDNLKNICNKCLDKYSLILISPTDVIVHIKEFPEQKKVTISFNYNGHRYKWIPITDTDFKNRYLQMNENNYSIRRPIYLVLSLGVCNPNDGCHYKLVATVLE